MGIEERDAARELFPPLPAIDLDGNTDVSVALATPDVLIDAAAMIRGYMLAFPTVRLAVTMALKFDQHLQRTFPGAHTFHFLLEGNVPETKKHERVLRSTARHAGLKRKGLDFSAPALDQSGLSPALRRAVPDTTTSLRDAIALYVARGAIALSSDEPGPEALERELVHQLMPELERLCLAAALGMQGLSTAKVAENSDTLPPEGEAKALPYARRLGRPCLFVGNDTDVFIISLLQVPRFPDHPPVYYYDIARTRGAPHAYVVDLVARVRVLPAQPGPANIALALLMCGNDYVPSPESKRMTLCQLARKRSRQGETYHIAYNLVAATNQDPEALTDLVATRFDAKFAYSRPHIQEYVNRALVAAKYYSADSLAEVPSDDVWLAHGWASMGVPKTVATMNEQ